SSPCKDSRHYGGSHRSRDPGSQHFSPRIPRSASHCRCACHPWPLQGSSTCHRNQHPTISNGSGTNPAANGQPTPAPSNNPSNVCGQLSDHKQNSLDLRRDRFLSTRNRPSKRHAQTCQIHPTLTSPKRKTLGRQVPQISPLYSLMPAHIETLSFVSRYPLGKPS